MISIFNFFKKPEPIVDERFQDVIVLLKESIHTLEHPALPGESDYDTIWTVSEMLNNVISILERENDR